MQKSIATFETFVPSLMFMITMVAVPVVFVVIASVGAEGELLRLFNI